MIENGQLEIYNVLGKNIYSEKIRDASSSFSKQINLNISKGVYFVKVSDNEKQYTSKLVVE